MADEPKDNMFDAMGNILEKGHFITLKPPEDQMWIGKITEVKTGEVSKIQKQIIPGHVRMVFDITMQVPPNSRYIKNILRVCDPKSEEIMRKAVEALDKEPPKPNVM